MRTEEQRRVEFDKLTDDILVELKKEESERELKRQEIIKNGCSCENKVYRIFSLTGVHYLECDICHKQFNVKEHSMGDSLHF